MMGLYYDGWHDPAVISGHIQQLRNQGAEVVIANFHSGGQFQTNPDQTQINVARAAIDNGADAVIEHHQHVLQKCEVYNGKMIVYSLGNFCYGGSNSATDTMIFQLKITKLGDEIIIKPNIIPCLTSDGATTGYSPMLADEANSARIMSQYGYDEFLKMFD